MARWKFLWENRILTGTTLIVKKFFVLILAVFAAFSCSDDAPKPLTPELVTEVYAIDLDNNGDASDIRVDFEVLDNLNVLEYRIVILPANLKNAFDQGVAEALTGTRYLAVDVQSFELEYSVSRLPSSVLDVNGLPIVQGQPYVAVVYVVGEGTRQLSPFSREFTLQDASAFAGFYRAVEASPVYIDSMRLDDASGGGYEATLFTYLQSQYELEAPFCTRFKIETVEFDINAGVIEEFLWVNLFCAEDTCDGLYRGSGVALDEITLEIDFIAPDRICPAFQEISVTMQRQ